MERGAAFSLRNTREAHTQEAWDYEWGSLTRFLGGTERRLHNGFLTCQNMDSRLSQVNTHALPSTCSWCLRRCGQLPSPAVIAVRRRVRRI